MKRLAAGGHAVLVDVVERRSWSTKVGVEPHLMRHRPLLSRVAENRAASSPVQKWRMSRANDSASDNEHSLSPERVNQSRSRAPSMVRCSSQGSHSRYVSDVP